MATRREPRPLGVWSLNIHIGHGRTHAALVERGMAPHVVQVRAYVAVPTQKAAMDALGVTRTTLVGWGGITGNAVAVKAARAHPGVVLVHDNTRSARPDGFVRLDTGETP